jgi:hypothetical protein
MFYVEGAPKKTTSFRLQNDGGDINIFANGELIAWFNASSGTLIRTALSYEETMRLPELVFEATVDEGSAARFSIKVE